MYVLINITTEFPHHIFYIPRRHLVNYFRKRLMNSDSLSLSTNRKCQITISIHRHFGHTLKINVTYDLQHVHLSFTDSVNIVPGLGYFVFCENNSLYHHYNLQTQTRNCTIIDHGSTLILSDEVAYADSSVNIVHLIIRI